ncbi:2-dehydro-3-deoxygalactonokinase [Citrobacter amalonaticus]|uniref:2-dehydro-3-deoxygalactonokinase n=1 Tax=Citrobacter amalonaticus TaxID=35703 RepID=UPI00255AC60A|nr:2-dehydro-3-deoxygalactonokinase [Citrobacter amalonaticus]MDL4618032.1 2-dehydro-3-deoxygalactonokinase [Citrobacter amalonaticus]MDL4622130.1 2-dehydro-3-deoxygalactonokinase [Citrobacter amalonaticus]
MFIIIDSGSSATRLYLMDSDDLQVIDRSVIQTGVNSTIDKGSNEFLKTEMASGIKELLNRHSLSTEEIEFIIASGMITSNLGLYEIPHQEAPADIEQLAKHAVRFAGNALLPVNIPVILIPGIKNKTTAQWQNLSGVDLMRGEETQAAGVLLAWNPTLPCTLIELGSTTKLISINEKGEIAGSITSLSGQVYAAILKQTFVAASIENAEDAKLDEMVIDAAYRSITQSGFLRTVLMTRFLQFSLPSTAAQRKLFLESAMACDDLKLLSDAQHQGFNLNGDVYLIGNASRCTLYHYIFSHYAECNTRFHIISDAESIDMLAITGASAIARAIQNNPQ